MNEERFDVLVIGAGPAGEKGAITASVFGRRVAVVERASQVGGAVANTGTLPSKTLRETALALSGLRDRELYGVDLSLRREATVADFMYHERNVSSAERQRILERFARFGVRLVQGTAAFEDPHTLRVVSAEGDRRLHGKTILIATGSAPHRPAEFPFADPRICDSDEILQLDRMPRTMTVVGAGVIGSEYACTFAALGCRVRLIDGKDELLGFLDREVARELTAAMERLGVTFHFASRVGRCEAPPAGPAVLTLDGGERLESDIVLVAAGRTSRTGDLNLAAAGLEAGERGILTVDRHFRTPVPHIYAAGDVIGFPALAATSMEQARVAMCHACDVKWKEEVSPILPFGIYTIPEVSMAGETEESLRKLGVDYVAGRSFYRENARGQIIGDKSGFVKLLFRRKDMALLGVHVLGDQATELIHVPLTVLHAGGGWDLLNRMCCNYPTLSQLHQAAAIDAMGRREGLL